jgi:hypothetical protein
MKFSPLSAINDGMNDIMYSIDTEGGRCGLLNLLAFSADEGDYFDRQGKIKEGLTSNYIKTDKWTLNPRQKSPTPPGIEPEQGVEYTDRAFVTIDGEKYRA